MGGATTGVQKGIFAKGGLLKGRTRQYFWEATASKGRMESENPGILGDRDRRPIIPQAHRTSHGPSHLSEVKADGLLAITEIQEKSRALQHT